MRVLSLPAAYHPGCSPVQSTMNDDVLEDERKGAPSAPRMNSRLGQKQERGALVQEWSSSRRKHYWNS